MDISDETKNKIKSSKQEQQEDQQSTTSIKRRALVKGSAAVIPTILTLRSGAILAQTQTSLTCKDKGAALDPQPISEVQDQFGRVMARRRDLAAGAVFRPLNSVDPWVTETGVEWEDTVNPNVMAQVGDASQTSTWSTETDVFILECPVGTTGLFCEDQHIKVTPSCMTSLMLSDPSMGD